MRALRGEDLAPLLDAQAERWRQHFASDYRPAAISIRRMLDRGVLAGRALVRDGRPLGYSHFSVAGRKALVGDAFVASGTEDRLVRGLVESTLNAACFQRGVERAEGHLLSLDRLPEIRPALRGTLRVHPRLVMRNARPGDARAARPDAARFAPWSGALLQQAAELMESSYRGHVDARIDDRYASAGGARLCLAESIAQSRSGRFFPPAAFVALDTRTSALIGMCLTSLLADDVGHILQLCVAPSARRRGLGSGLLGRALRALAGAGCRMASLIATESNENAVRLYRRHGFRAGASFPSFVWERIE